MATQSAQVSARQRNELGSRANKRLRDGGKLPASLAELPGASVPKDPGSGGAFGYVGEGASFRLYGVGGDHDPQGRSGLAHLVEHVYVTAAAGETPSRTAEEYFQRYRAGCNAQTGDRYTVIATVFGKGELDGELRDPQLWPALEGGVQ